MTPRIRVVTTYASGPREDKSVIIFTGALDAALKHPAAPPSTANAWTSYLPAYVQRDMTIFPTQDSTTITITDLSDGDDLLSFTLASGDLVGDYDFFTADLWSRVGQGLVPRALNPRVAPLTLPTLTAPFDSDFVQIEADRPVLVYVGPKASDTFEYADVAYPVRTGPASWLSYCYAQNGGAEDFQLFAFDPATAVRITSLSYTKGFGAQVTG